MRKLTPTGERGIHRREGGGYLVRTKVNGITVRRVVDTLGEAKAARTLLRRQRQGLEASGASVRLTLKGICDAYTDEVQRLGKNAKPLKATLKRAIDFFGPNKSVPLTEKDLIDFAEWVLTSTDSKGELAVRGCIYLRTAHEKAGLPRPKAPRVKWKRGERRIPPKADVLRWLQALTWGSPERALVEIMLNTGARLQEVLRLNVGDIRGDVLVSENRKARYNVETVEYPINSRLAEILKTVVPPGSPASLPIIRIEGRRASYDSFRKRLIAASIKAEVTPAIQSLAWMRNFTATLLVDNGVPITVVSKLLNHDSVKTTQRHYDKAQMLKDRTLAAQTIAEACHPSSHLRGTPLADPDRNFVPETNEAATDSGPEEETIQ